MAQGARRDEGSAAAAKAQYLLRQMASENDALKAQKAELEEEVSKQQGQVAALQSKIKSLEKNVGSKETVLARYKETDAALRDRIELQRSKMQEIIDKFKEVVATLREVEAERNKLTMDVTNLDREVRTCAENNVKLYESGLEVLNLYENKGVWDSLFQTDPVTALKQVEIENLVQDYRNRMQDEMYQVVDAAQ
jgi:chromosome segregation ATPase